MKRDAEQRLLRWHARAKRKPLVIRGARQVGKSTLVRNFARDRGLRLVEINLERHRRLNTVFESMRTEEILHELSFAAGGASLVPPDTVLFLDEIQATPAAIPFLRYLYEDVPDLPVIAAGSLLEFVLAEHSFSMPVGRIEYLFLGPVTFFEFLGAAGHSAFRKLLSSYAPGCQLPGTAHRRLLELLRTYFLVGGMPEAVATYIETRTLADVFDVHSAIIETYLDDFGKYARQAQLTALQTVFNYVPSSIGRKVKYARVDRTLPARAVKAAIDLLAKAGVITRAYHTSASGMPLRAGVDHRAYKLYFLDVGLMNSVCGTRRIALPDMTSQRFVNEGTIAEQFVAQHLLHAGPANASPELNYWLREGRATNAEVDFLIVASGHVLPVEVKAGKSGALKSLHLFAHQKNAASAIRLDLNPPSRQQVCCRLALGGQNSVEVSYELTSLPVYMAGLLTPEWPPDDL